MTTHTHTVAPNPHNPRYPWRWWCCHTIPATAITGDTTTRDCPATGTARSETGAHTAALGHIATDHPTPTTRRPDQGRHQTETPR